MDCCSSTDVAQAAPVSTPEIDKSADWLGALLAQTPEYQEFIRLAHLINLDPDVKRLSMAIRSRQTLYSNPDGVPVAALQMEMEALQSVQAYRKAEAALKDLFHAVDDLISASVGIAFAPNALRSGCG